MDRPHNGARRKWTCTACQFRPDQWMQADREAILRQWHEIPLTRGHTEEMPKHRGREQVFPVCKATVPRLLGEFGGGRETLT